MINMLKIIDGVLIQEKLTEIRKNGIDRANFRAGMIEIGEFLAYEFINTMKTETVAVKTPLGIADGIKIKNKEDVVVVSVLRAAIPLVDGILKVFPEARCGVVGAEREDKPPFGAKIEYIKIPDVEDKIVIVADPMLATGNTMNSVLSEIKKHGTPKRLVIFNVISTREGIRKVSKNHPEVEIYTCSIERKLSRDGYIVPGLGDAGDIAFGIPR